MLGEADLGSRAQGESGGSARVEERLAASRACEGAEPLCARARSERTAEQRQAKLAACPRTDAQMLAEGGASRRERREGAGTARSGCATGSGGRGKSREHARGSQQWPAMREREGDVARLLLSALVLLTASTLANFDHGELRATPASRQALTLTLSCSLSPSRPSSRSVRRLSSSSLERDLRERPTAGQALTSLAQQVS